MSNTRPVLPRIAAGDKTAVDECLQRYGGLIWSLTRRRCADVQLAEDAVQNIFLHLWKVAGTFDENIANETTFIAMVARRRLIDFHRQQMTKKDFVHCEFDHLQMTSVEPLVKLEINEEAARAQDLLNQLPKDQQRVIRMSVFDGLSHSKIADRTGLKLGTVKTHIRRGLTKIRESLFKENATADKTINSNVPRAPKGNTFKGNSFPDSGNAIERKPYSFSNKSRPNKNRVISTNKKLGGLSSN